MSDAASSHDDLLANQPDDEDPIDYNDHGGIFVIIGVIFGFLALLTLIQLFR